MAVVTSDPPRKGSGETVPARMVRLLFGVLLSAVFLLGGSGRWGWPAAWAYLIAVTAGAFGGLLFIMRQPGLLEERTSRWREGKRWDKPLVLALAVVGPWAIQIVCALDERFAWSAPFGSRLQAAGFTGIVVGVLLTFWALWVNPFFSAVVRIQRDRGHTVVTTGPYRFLRHPGYLGALLSTVGSPMLLDSSWGFIPASMVVLALLIRTAREDATLRAELEGYSEYAAKTRYRLVPLVW